MAKYYIASGYLEEIVVADDPKKACLIAFKKYIGDNGIEDLHLGHVITVSESGFTISPQDIIFLTFNILEALGIEDQFIADNRSMEEFLATKRGHIISALVKAEENLITSLNQLKNHDLEDEFLLKLTEMKELSRRISIYKDPELDEPAINTDDELEEKNE